MLVTAYDTRTKLTVSALDWGSGMHCACGFNNYRREMFPLRLNRCFSLGGLVCMRREYKSK